MSAALLATPAPLPLHSLPIWVDVCAAAVAAAFGAATGRNRRLPLLAVLLAGVIAGLVGGMIRDVLLGSGLKSRRSVSDSTWPLSAGLPPRTLVP